MTNNFIDLADAGEDNDSNLGVAKDGELLSLYRRREKVCDTVRVIGKGRRNEICVVREVV